MCCLPQTHYPLVTAVFPLSAAALFGRCDVSSAPMFSSNQTVYSCSSLQLYRFKNISPNNINLNENSTEVSLGTGCATRIVLTVHCVRYIQNIGKHYNIPIRKGKSINGLNLIIRQATHKTAIVKALERSTNVLLIISYLYSSISKFM